MEEKNQPNQTTVRKDRRGLLPLYARWRRYGVQRYTIRGGNHNERRAYGAPRKTRLYIVLARDLSNGGGRGAF